MAFYIRGLSTTLKFCLALFATDTVSASELVPLFWDAVSYLEKTCNLWVIAVTSDGASSNRSFYRLLCGKEMPIPFKVRNLEAPWRFIFLFCDVPHLIKTLRNALYSSGTNSVRYLWNNGFHLLWEHISKLYYFNVVDFSNYSNFSEREENSVLLNNLFFWESIVHSLFLHGRSCSTMNKTYAAIFNGNALFSFVHFYEEQFVP